MEKQNNILVVLEIIWNQKREIYIFMFHNGASNGAMVEAIDLHKPQSDKGSVSQAD